MCEEKIKQDQFKVYERNGQLVISLNSEIILPENAPVRLTSAQLEELNYEKLYGAYSPRGRKSKVDPRVMFKVMVYGYQCGIYSSRKLDALRTWPMIPKRTVSPAQKEEVCSSEERLLSC